MGPIDHAHEGIFYIMTGKI